MVRRESAYKPLHSWGTRFAPRHGMIHLHFKGVGPGDEATLGPASSFRVAGNFIRDAESGEILARYLNHFWEVGNKHFTRYECPEKPWMHFEDVEGGSTPYYGPLANVLVTDGSVHTGEKLIAKFIDPTQLWHDVQSDTYWQNMILSDSPPTGARDTADQAAATEYPHSSKERRQRRTI